MWLQSCPRCGGDLFLRDLDFEAQPEEGMAEVVCLQCGHIMPQHEADKVVKEAGIADTDRRVA